MTESCDYVMFPVPWNFVEILELGGDTYQSCSCMLRLTSSINKTVLISIDVIATRSHFEFSLHTSIHRRDLVAKLLLFHQLYDTEVDRGTPYNTSFQTTIAHHIRQQTTTKNHFISQAKAFSLFLKHKSQQSKIINFVQRNGRNEEQQYEQRNE